MQHAGQLHVVHKERPPGEQTRVLEPQDALAEVATHSRFPIPEPANRCTAATMFA